MNAWHFILGAYVVTAIAMIVEVLVARAAHRAALDSTRAESPARRDPRRDDNPA